MHVNTRISKLVARSCHPKSGAAAAAAAVAAAAAAGGAAAGSSFRPYVASSVRRSYSRSGKLGSSGRGGKATAPAANVPDGSGKDDGNGKEDGTAGRESSVGAGGDTAGAMSRRLEQMTDEMVEGVGGRRARKAVEEAGFSEDLKRRLEQRIAEDQGSGSKLDSTASSVLTMPTSAGAGTRDAAMAKPWTGSESIEDASLRMLTDSHKPLRGGAKGQRAAPKRVVTGGGSVDTRMKAAAAKANSGQRLLNARDKTSIYAISQDPNLSEKEKEDMRKILRERFQPGARPMPTTIQGLASLANERIEDAIARGQFKNIARGKGVNQQVDYNANSPFLNTTEYFMNKMIQRQDIVPPWIEKQQEVIKTAATFRSRLRNDWRRHAARTIASKGGSLRDQIRRAEAYARAEAELNPRPQKVESISQIDATGRLATQINVVETPLPSSAGEQQQRVDGDSAAVPDSSKITIAETEPGASAAAATASEAATAANTVIPSDAMVRETPSPTSEPPLTSQQPSSFSHPSPSPDTNTSPIISPNPSPTTPPSPPSPETPLALPPLRDPAWESIELAYHTAALKALNTLTRSYNLMAPELAKRPYYSLPRELASCFADVAPQLAEALRERARRPEKVRVEVIGHKQGGVLERFAGESARVYDSKKPHYGFKEFWRELWRRDGVRQN